MFSANIVQSFAIDGVKKAVSVVVSAGKRLSYSEAIPASSTDLLVAGNIDVSQLKAFWIKSDVALTIETNSGSSPADTITLTAGRPVIWDHLSGETNPLTTDVTAFYITEGAGSAANLEMEFLVDSTV